MTRLAFSTIIAVSCLLPASMQAAPFKMETDKEGVTVKLDGQLFTRYLIKSGAKPILWPVIGPTGKEMTRGYPMRDAAPTEKQDHVHQRSLWFTHGDVDGVDFWGELKNHGEIVHREFVKVEGGERGLIVTRNDWIGPDGKRHCQDERTLAFGAGPDARWIDFDAVVTASDGQVTFGDTKEGSFGVRVAGSMRVDLGQGGKIVNSDGLTDKDAWGKRAAWVDYSGPVDGEILGIAILNHPSSFRYPTYWHVRTYGLFTANPFGLSDFLGSKEVNGAHTLQPGQSFSLRHRVLLHKGGVKEGRVAEAYAEYAALKK